MNKRGQVFLIAAVILALALFSVSVVYNSISVSPPLVEYRRLSENYLIEYPKVVNFARFYDADEASAISGFNNVFLGFARQKEPNFGVFYTFKDSRGNVNIVNTLNKKVLHIEVVDPRSSEDLSFVIFPEGIEQRDNHVCIEGVCNSVSVDISDYGGRYSNEQQLSDIGENAKLVISEEGIPSSYIVDLSKFVSTVITSSELETTPVTEGFKPDSVREVKILNYE